MNRIEALLEKIQFRIKALSMLEEKYENKIKGAIYNASKDFNEKKIIHYKETVENFGSGIMNEWFINGYYCEPLCKEKKQTLVLYLEESITEEEIFTRLALCNIKVESIIISKSYKMGFPRISKK